MKSKVALIAFLGLSSNASAMPINTDWPDLSSIQFFAETGINIFPPFETIEEVEQLHSAVQFFCMDKR